MRNFLNRVSDYSEMARAMDCESISSEDEVPTVHFSRHFLKKSRKTAEDTKKETQTQQGERSTEDKD